MDDYIAQLAEWHAEQSTLSERRAAALAGERFQREVLAETQRRELAHNFGTRYDKYVELVRRRDLMQDMLFPTQEEE